jgi:hypothetical protein
MMSRIEVLRLLIEFREDGIDKDERVFLVDEERKESEGSCWDPDEIREIDVPDPRYS